MSSSKIISDGILRSIFVLVAITVCLYFLYSIGTVLLYLVISLLLTLIASPIQAFLKRKLKFKHILATITTISIFILVIVGFITMLVPLISDQGNNLSLLKTAEIEKNIAELTNQVVLFLANYNIDARELLKSADLSSKINFNFIPTLLNSLLGTLSSFGMGLGSILFITFFFLKDELAIVRNFRKLIPKNHSVQVVNSLVKINHLLSRYFAGLMLQLFIVFILYIIVLFIFDIENLFVIAFLCAILNIVPYIGPLIASVLAAVLTMISNLDADFQTMVVPTTIYVLIGFWIVQIIDNNVSQPLIFSKSVSSHPLEIFLVTLIAGFLTGILGMIVAIPLYTILKVIAKEFFPENKVIQLLTKEI